MDLAELWVMLIWLALREERRPSLHKSNMHFFVDYCMLFVEHVHIKVIGYYCILLYVNLS